jgi:hypothetical protein
MVTALWVLFDLVVVWRTDLMTKPLSTTDKAVLVLIGVGVAIFGGISEYRDSNKMDQLVADSSFAKGQLSALSTTLGTLAAKSGAGTNDSAVTIAQTAAAKIDKLQGQIAALQDYKTQHEADEWPALSTSEQEQWRIALAPLAAKVHQVEITETIPGSEFLVDSLTKALDSAGFPRSHVFPVFGGSVPNGIVVDGGPTDAITAVATLLSSHLNEKFPLALHRREMASGSESSSAKGRTRRREI